MTVILGPVPCQGCRWPVTWNGWEWQDTAGWDPAIRTGRQAGHRHACPQVAASERAA